MVKSVTFELEGGLMWGMGEASSFATSFGSA